MFQSLRQRTFFDYQQKTVDTYCAFILYNMKLSMSESFADYDLPEPKVIPVAVRTIREFESQMPTRRRLARHSASV